MSNYIGNKCVDQLLSPVCSAETIKPILKDLVWLCSSGSDIRNGGYKICSQTAETWKKKFCLVCWFGIHCRWFDTLIWNRVEKLSHMVKYMNISKFFIMDQKAMK